MIKIGDRVQHRAWYWIGTVIEVPEDIHDLSYIKVKRDDGKIQEVWMPSIITNTDHFIYDWSDLNT